MQTLNTSIQLLGLAEISSPLSAGTAEHSLSFLIDQELEESFTEPQNLNFELAGPRNKLYFDPSKTKCAIVTCGGLCPGINDVIRSIVMTAYNTYNLPSVIGIRYGLQGFIPSYKYDVLELTPQNVSSIQEFGGTILGTSRGPQNPEAVVNALERMNINILFVIGGDGTMKAAASIHQEVNKRNNKIAVIGIPKTIDNDINFIPNSFGFETAVQRATDAIRCAHIEAASVFNGLGIVKIMGRDSGFIAASAAFSLQDVDFVLIPEVPFDLHGPGGLLSALELRLKSNKHAVLVVAEGAGKHLLSPEENFDASGNRLQSDITALLMQEIAKDFTTKNIPYYLKFIDPSYTIRSVPANANDRIYCGLLGQHALHAAMSGKTGMVVAKLMDKFVHLPLHLVTKKRRTLNIHSDLWRAVLEATRQGDILY